MEGPISPYIIARERPLLGLPTATLSSVSGYGISFSLLKSVRTIGLRAFVVHSQQAKAYLWPELRMEDKCALILHTIYSEKRKTRSILTLSECKGHGLSC
jgi:hypothetical protein